MLSTHILDVAAGAPAEGIAVTLYRVDGERRRIAGAKTDADGRIPAPFGGALEPGTYEIVFAVGSYFAVRKQLGGAFYDEIPVRFRIESRNAKYHVPLLLAPWGYSTYRGS
ncbi:MAG: hydroxyisourate hydrolase [Candidatus Eremiobacteraeota bacterium]|nr:hydroxyisourate hydrolase [Candidatus Eremiobacteraeota bacterium]